MHTAALTHVATEALTSMHGHAHTHAHTDTDTHTACVAQSSFGETGQRGKCAETSPHRAILFTCVCVCSAVSGSLHPLGL